MTEKEAVKKLTQAQKNYLVKRINDIANMKSRELGSTVNYGTAYQNYPRCSSTPNIQRRTCDKEVLLAIIKGDVKLRSKADMLAEIKSIATDKVHPYYKLDSLTFINLKSLGEFNAARNKENERVYKAKQKRLTSIRDEADKLKDSVMLDGNLAIELLEEFEKKEF